MKEKIVYVAFDGTEFADEDECFEYEQKCVLNTVQMFDDNCHRTNDLNECKYIYFQSDIQAEKFLDTIFPLCKFNWDFSYGLYMYDEVTYKWIQLDLFCDSFVNFRGMINSIEFLD